MNMPKKLLVTKGPAMNDLSPNASQQRKASKQAALPRFEFYKYA